MISLLAKKTTNLIFPGIEDDEAELCTYFFFILYSKWLSFAEVLLSGIILKNIWSAILFYFIFTPLREYSGGIHARKERTCIFCTALVLFSSVAAIKLLESQVGWGIQGMVLLFGTGAIFLFSPLDTLAKPIFEEERLLYGQKSRRLSIAADIFAIICFLLGFHSVTNVISVALALEGILLIAGKIQSKFSLQHVIN